MTVRVLYFASLKDRTGIEAESVEVAAGLTVEGLWARLAARHPGLAEVRRKPRVACDAAFAPWTTPLDGVTEVAFLPPMSGG